jgi:2'-5' RNA ligase
MTATPVRGSRPAAPLDSPGEDYPAQQRRLLARVRRDVRAADAASSVPRVADYAADAARSLTIVAFPPASVRAAIATQLQAPLAARASAHYYYPAASFHITIKNVRQAAAPPNFDAGDVARVAALLPDVARACAPVTFTFHEVLAFPNSLSLIGYSSAALQALVLNLDRALRAAGLPDDKRYMSDTVFFGNITFCRFTTDPTPAWLEAARTLTLASPVEVNVNELNLITCNAAAAPQTIERHGTFALKR